MVITFADQLALTPAGKPFAPVTPELLMPVAEEVEWVILDRTVLIHKVGLEDAVTAELAGFTVIVTLSVALQPFFVTVSW
jgi:hypothetical protein